MALRRRLVLHALVVASLLASAAGEDEKYDKKTSLKSIDINVMPLRA